METQKNNQQPSLYERLGGEQRVRKILNDVLDRNLNNPLIGNHFRQVDMNRLKQLVFEFFSMGTGGPHTYTGRDTRSAHAHLVLNEKDFELSNEDVIIAFKENGVAQTEIDEVIGILNSLKGEVLGV